ncbi:hypothetical protein J7E96_20730 [Streptomyces sp. ISL-96]|uniref:hypothetical protein n=1 Tax=Streptomyces sp. ISL-96 TaxID=2819191 RepID=UPI001BE9ACBD|nr:hypothetical protein [Streptomyces sp. ISL-96]MBT2490896.1 hypothetical protein [Streptomyces sp. ISL-96]
MKSSLSVPLPLAECAFDDPATRQGFEKVRRRARISLLIRVAVWLGLLIVATAFKEEETQLVSGAASFLLIPTAFLLPAPGRALLWLRAVEKVLKSHPWRYCSAVRRPDAKVSAGTAVQLRFGDGGDGGDAGDGRNGVGDEGWTPVLAAGTWRLRKRWSKELEYGAWFAGNPGRGGVLALPGGHRLMTLHLNRP